MFLFENVKGIRTASWNGNGTSVWDHVLAEFKGIKGYDVEPALLHAKHYGVPRIGRGYLSLDSRTLVGNLMRLYLREAYCLALSPRRRKVTG